MDTDDSPIESERATNNSNGKWRNSYGGKAKQQIGYQQQPPRFQNITKQLSTTVSRPEYRAASKSPINLFRDNQQLTEKAAIQIVLRPCEIVLQGQLHMLQAQMVLTTGGLRYVLKLGDHWINLSWLHSIKRIERNKILVLFYHMNPVLDGRKPSLEPQLLEFTEREVAEQYAEALQVLHRGLHDPEIERLYHQTL